MQFAAANQDGNNYFVLLILTDGVISGWYVHSFEEVLMLREVWETKNLVCFSWGGSKVEETWNPWFL